MARHVMALTYEPKVQAVQDGYCRQTIRKVGKRSINPGDTITFHGWEGRPYRSPWSWRKEVLVTSAVQIIVHEEGIATPPTSDDFVSGPVCHWEDNYCATLAQKDHIEPPTGETLRDVLFDLSSAPNGPELYNIIRW